MPSPGTSLTGGQTNAPASSAQALYEYQRILFMPVVRDALVLGFLRSS